MPGSDIKNLGQFVGRYGSGFGSIGGFLATPILPGDADASGGVDFADFEILRQNFGRSAATDSTPTRSRFRMLSVMT
jgi:hypothetical protein